jgi:cellulose synthase/poly-beta-1,6-N-acetylglucosamine synthase-like glycosyltransferase
MTPWTPRVTIAMPAFNEERYVEACIASVQAQDYPRDLIEILVADGRSTDQTRRILARLAVTDPRIRVVDNPRRLQAAGLCELVTHARGEVIVRMDVHCEYAPDYVRRCVEALARTGADNVGGAQRAKARTPFQRAVCAALASPLGTGGVAYRATDREGFVDTVFLGAFRRRVFERVGMWDPNAITNEDSELNQRILEAGGRIFLARDVVVHYFPRDSLRALATQYFRYGQGRARTLLKHGRFPRLRPLVPFLAMSGVAATLLVPPLWPLAPATVATYALATGAEAVRVGRGLGTAGVTTVWRIFPVLHASHAAGFWAGLVRYLRAPDWKSARGYERLAVRDPDQLARDGELHADGHARDHRIGEPREPEQARRVANQIRRGDAVRALDDDARG